VEAMGIFVPQAIFLAIAVVMILAYGKKFKDLELEPLSSWHLSDKAV